MKVVYIALVGALLTACHPAYGYHWSYYGNHAGTPPRYQYYDYRVDPYTAQYRAFLCRAGEIAAPLQHPQPIGTPCTVFVNGYPLQGTATRN
jgi:hypothetical protein